MTKNYCTRIPSIGENLFKELKKRFGYPLARKVFLRAINPKFIEDYKNTLSLDAEGIPSIESLLKNPYIKDFIGETKIIQGLEKDYTELEDTIENYNIVLEQAYNFNTTSAQRDSYVAYVDSSNSKLKLKIVPKTELESKKFEEQYSFYILAQRLIDIFKPLGLNINMLSNKEVNAGRVGVTDFSNIKDTALEFSNIIRIANNSEGARAISEEFSHLLIGIFRNEPLITRAINYLSSNEEALREVLGNEYQDTINFHNGNRELIAEEALGKILEKNLLNNVNIKQPLYKRIIEFIKNKFKQFNSNNVEDAISYANTVMNTLSKEILNGTKVISREDILASKRDIQFNALSDRIQRNIDILKDAAKVEIKRLKINKSADTKAAKYIIDEILQFTEEDADTAKGLMNYSYEALKTLRGLFSQFDTLENMTPEQKFKFLRLVRQYISSYGNFIDRLSDAVEEDSLEEDNMFLSTYEIDGQMISVPEVIKELNSYSHQLTRKFNTAAMTAFAEFLKPFLGENIVAPFGKYAGQEVSVDLLLKEANSDISFLDRWLDSMADSSDTLLQLFDSAVKKQKDIARLETIDLLKEIESLRIEAESKGITSFDWMFETDNEGNRSGDYISEVNNAQFNKDLEEFEEYLKDKYGKNPKGELAKQKIQERRAWMSIHSTNILIPKANIKLYRNIAYDSLSTVQKDILNRYLILKERLDSKLPENRVDKLKAIQMRRGGSERLLQSGSLSSAYENIKEMVSNTFLDRVDDNEEFGVAKGIMDFTGREFMTLPVLYTNRLENPNEITSDVFGSLAAYAYMACNYEQMDKIVDPLEIGKILVSEQRKVMKTRGNKQLVEEVNALGIKAINKVLDTDSTNIVAKLNDFMDSQVYGRYLKDEGSFEIFGKAVNNSKLVNFVLKMSSTAQLGFNWLANLANATTGLAMQNIEAAANEFFSPSELLKADLEYAKAMKEFSLEIGSRNKTSKLALFDELFNIKQDFDTKVRANKKKNILQRVFGSNIAFLGQEAGDHWLYNRTAIAMALRQKVNVPNKGTMSLWEAMQVVDADSSGKVKKLSFPKGTTLENGEELNVSSIGRRMAHVNQHLFGIYNQDDANAANRVALGRLLMQYRKWMKPQFNKRFQAAQYNVTTESWEEGYYRTMFRIANELVRGKTQLAAIWQDLTTHEKANVKRAITEIAQFFVVWMLANLIDWDDDENRPWAQKLAEYTTRRLEHELGGLMPLHTGFIQENWKNVKTPMASISTIDSILKLMDSIVTPSDWTDELKSGPYKGYSTLEKNLLKSPIPGITHYRQIDRFLENIDTSINYYIRSY